MTSSEVENPEIASGKMAEGRIEGEVGSIDGPVRYASVAFGAINVLTDHEGKFVLDHVPPGLGKISVKSPVTKFRDYEKNILIEDGEGKTDIFVFLEVMAGTIEGVVSDENGIPLVGAEVSGAFKSGKPSETMKTDDRGHYVFSGISSGSYYVRAKAEGHMIEGAQASIIGGGTALVNFVLKTGSLSITGEVLTQKDHKPADCQISLMRNGVVVTTTYTKASGDGEYTFENLVPDLYEIGVVSTGYSCKGWRGRIERSEALDFQLETPSLETYSRCHDPNWEDSGLLG